MIEVVNLTRRYGDFVAVNDISLQIAQGEVVGLLGHNGAGKTTVMKMLTGYLEPSAGTIRVAGSSVSDDPLVVQAQMGYLPESPPTYPEMTVADYLSYAARMRGLEPRDCVCEAIAATNIGAKAMLPISTLSRGFRQRVGVAQAILHRPKFLILDEPSNGLDPSQIQEMRRLIRSLAETATVILSTHIMQEVTAVCDRVLILRSGALVVDESLATLTRADGVELSTDAAVDVSSVLANVSEVLSAMPIDAGRWHIQGQDTVANEALAAKVTQAMVARAEAGYAIHPKVRNLDALFAAPVAAEETGHAS